MNRELVFASGSRELAGRLFSPAEREPSGAGILFIHGLGSDQRGYQRRAEAASDGLGATCLTFDLSGHGSSGKPDQEFSPRDHLDDALAAFDILVDSDEVDAGRVGVCAASYGAYIAALLISSRPVDSLLLRAPALYSDRCLDRKDGAGKSSLETPGDSAALRGIAAYRGPIMVVESERDEIIPRAIVEAYLEVSARGRHEVIPHAGHRLANQRWKAMFIDILVDWFRDTLPAGRR